MAWNFSTLAQMENILGYSGTGYPSIYNGYRGPAVWDSPYSFFDSPFSNQSVWANANSSLINFNDYNGNYNNPFDYRSNNLTNQYTGDLSAQSMIQNQQGSSELQQNYSQLQQGQQDESQNAQLQLEKEDESQKAPLQLEKEDENNLVDYYKQTNSMAQNWDSLLPSATMMAFTENAQNFKHSYNAIQACSSASKVFDLSNPAIKKIWTQNPEVAQEAYSQLQALNRILRPKKKYCQQWFQRAVTDKSSEAYKTLTNLEKEMSKALHKGDLKGVATATEKIRAARGMDGYIPTAWNKTRGFFTGKKIDNLTPKERINKKSVQIQDGVKRTMERTSGTMSVGSKMKSLARNSVKEGGKMSLLTTFIEIPKIISAAQDGGTGAAIKQLFQTGGKALANGAGWAVGRAAGTAIGTKLGATIGTFCGGPGIGTAVGAAVGFICGTIGSIIADKITSAVLGDDIAVELAANKKIKTAEGQAELAQLVLSGKEAGEDISDEVVASANKVVSVT